MEDDFTVVAVVRCSVQKCCEPQPYKCSVQLRGNIALLYLCPTTLCRINLRCFSSLDLVI